MEFYCGHCEKNLGPFDLIVTTTCKTCGALLEQKGRMGGPRKYNPEVEIDRLLKNAEVKSERVNTESDNPDGLQWKLSLGLEWHCDLIYDPQFGGAYSLRFSTPLPRKLNPDDVRAFQAKFGLLVDGYYSAATKAGPKLLSIQADWVKASQLLPINAEGKEMLAGCVARLNAAMQEIKAFAEE